MPKQNGKMPTQTAKFQIEMANWEQLKNVLCKFKLLKIHRCERSEAIFSKGSELKF